MYPIDRTVAVFKTLCSRQ